MGVSVFCYCFTFEYTTDVELSGIFTFWVLFIWAPTVTGFQVSRVGWFHTESCVSFFSLPSGVSFWGHFAHLVHTLHPVIIGLAAGFFIVCITTLTLESKEKKDKGDKREIDWEKTSGLWIFEKCLSLIIIKCKFS